jgi:6-pyruvoyltetrahydropterin/6-carboxytetrahydropterin synthase
MLLPTSHPLIHVEAGEREVITTFREKRWVFPREDCMLLPVSNTTAEKIAWWIAHELKSAMYSKVGDQLTELQVAVDENNGQWGICEIDW